MTCFKRFLVLLLILSGSCLALPGQSPDARSAVDGGEQETRAALIYRRVYVPSKDLPSLIKGLMPIRRDEVEAMIQVINRAARANPAADRVRISRAHYRARLRGDQLVAGEARLQVERLDPPEAEPEEPVEEESTAEDSEELLFLPLKPMGLAIGVPHWHFGEDQESPVAIVGRDSNGSQVCLVPRSGRLDFPWSLKGQRDSLGELHFDLQLPTSPASQLLLELPANVTPQIDRGIISQAAVPPENPPAENPEATAASQPETLNWVLEFGGHDHVRLTIAPENPFRQRSQLTFLRQTTVYGLSNAGLDVTIQLNLDVYNEPLRQFAVQMGELQLIDARIGDDPVKWSFRGTAEDGHHELLLPEAILGQNHLLVLRATGKMQTGRRWHVPMVRLPDAVWREGEIQLMLPESVMLKRLQVNGGKVTRVVPADAGGENRVIQLYQPAADIEVVVERRDEEIQLETSLEIAILPPRVTARFVASLSSSFGARFDISGAIAPGWIVDSVETEPASLIESYDIVTPAQDDSSGRLQVLLKRAISLDRPARLVVRAHRPTNATGLTGDILQPLRIEDVEDGRQVVSVRVDPSFQLQLEGDAGLLRLEREELSEEEATAVNAQAAALLYQQSPVADRLVLFVQRLQPRFSAEIAVQAEVDGNTLKERYLVGCTPRSSSLNRLVFHFHEPRDELFRWQLVNHPEVSLSARKLTAEDQSGLGLVGGETWELVLPESMGTRFDLELQRESEIQEASRVSLLMLPGATSQLASLAILARDGGNLQVEARRLKPIPPPVVPVDTYLPIRAMYRYQPSLDSDVILSHDTSSEQKSLAWAWQMMMRSRFTSNGVIHHQVSYFMENVGRRRIRFLLPGTVEDLQVLVDGEQITVNNATTAGASVIVTLPEKKRFCTVQLYYREQGPPLGSISSLTGRAPEPNCPVLDGRWEVLLPAGYHPLEQGVGLSGQQRPVSWGKRLFGPFWREFDSGLAFVNKQSPLQRSLPALMEQSEKTIHQLDLLLQGIVASGQPADWGDLIAGSGQFPASGLSEIWFDQRALQAAGVTPSTMLSSQAFSMAELLRSFHLQLLVSEGVLVVTSTDSPLLVGLSVQWSGELLAIAPSLEFTFPEMVRNHGLMSSSVWIAHGELAPIPWNRHQDVASPGRADRHWNISWHPIQSQSPVQLQVYHQVTMQSLGWAVFLLLVGLFSWLSLHSPAWHPRIVVACFVLAMLAPAITYPFPTAAWLAAIASQVLVVLHHRTELGEGGKKGQEQFSFRLQLAPRNLLILFLFFGFLGLAVTRGQDPEGAPDDVRQQDPKLIIHRMLIPVDEENEPVGQYNFVPEPFFDGLHRRSAELSQRQSDWLFRSADYVSNWEWSVDMEQLLDGVITATYQLEVLKNDVGIQVPIRTDQVQLGDVLLDGQPVQLEISPQDRQLSFQVEQAGSYELSLRLTPRAQSEDGFSFIQFAIPPIANSQFRLQLPLDAPLPRLPGCLGMTSYDEVSGQLVGELGPLNELTIRWPENSRLVPVESEVEVESSFWLRVRPNAVTLDAQFRFDVLLGSVKTIQLETDPRLRLVSVQGGEFVAGQPRVRNDEQQTILLSLDNPQQEEFMLETTFYLNQASGIGNLQLPRLEVVADRHGDRLVAMTVSDQLEGQVDAGEMVEEIAIEQFGEAWGTDELPQRAFRLTSEESEWNLLIQDRLPRLSASELIDIHVDHRRLDLVYTADLDVSDSSLLQLQLESPAGFQLQAASLEQQEVQVPLRAAPSDGDGTVLFLDRPVLGQQRLVVRGVLAITGNQIPVPLIRLRGARIDSGRVRIFRYHGVTVGFDKLDPSAVYKEGGGQLLESTSRRLVGEFDLAVQDVAETAAPAVIVLNEDRRDFQAVMVTRVSQQDNQWIARVDCELTVPEAVVDQLRFEVPGAWSETISVSPEMPFEIRPIPMQSRQQLVLLPEKPLEGKTRVSFSARLPAASGTFRVPDVFLLDAATAVRYLVLPRRLEDNQVQWATSGLQRIPGLPTPFSDLPVDDTSLVFRGILPDFEARISDVQQTGGLRRVSLADVRVHHGHGGHVFGVATLDLEPSGSQRVVVQIPGGYKLIHASVAGLAARQEPLSEDRVSLFLVSSQLPQRIELLFSGKYELAFRGQESWRCDFPRLEKIPMGRVTWTILSDRKVGLPEALDGIPAISGTSIEVGRLNQLIDMNALSAELAAVSQPVSNHDWYLPWQRQYLQARKRLAREELQQGIRPEDSLLPGIDEEKNHVNEQLGFVEELADEELVNPPSLGDMFDALSGGSPTIARFASSGDGEPLTVQFPVTGGGAIGSVVGRWILVIILLTGIFLCSRNPQLLDHLGRWPFAWGALGGLAWWLWLSPSVVGVLIMLLSASGALRAARGSWLAVAAGPIRDHGGSTVTYVKR